MFEKRFQFLKSAMSQSDFAIGRKRIDGPVFLLGFYRGGTTYVQRLLNCSSELIIWGEHAGILDHYQQAFVKYQGSSARKVDLSNERESTKIAKKFVPWANRQSKEDYKRLLRQHIGDMFGAGSESTRWGFKEIRYHSVDIADFLFELFPAAKIIYLHRAPEDVFVSQYFKKSNKNYDPSDLPERINRFINTYVQRIANHHEVCAKYANAQIFSYEDLQSPRDHLERLTDFLGVDPDTFDTQKIATVVNARVGSSFSDNKSPWNISSVDDVREQFSAAMARH